MPDTTDKSQPVIVFDGVCNLCSSVVRFVIKRDNKSRFRFASLQSAFGQALLRQFNLPHSNYSSFILYRDGKIHTRSTAALMVARQLPGAWPLLYCFIIVPPFIRNLVYNFISANRYKWFGKKEACYIPSPALKARFIE